MCISSIRRGIFVYTAEKKDESRKPLGADPFQECEANNAGLPSRLSKPTSLSVTIFCFIWKIVSFVLRIDYFSLPHLLRFYRLGKR
jgi:hypothetical protein